LLNFYLVPVGESFCEGDPIVQNTKAIF
jgi:hypothetical protein